MSLAQRPRRRRASRSFPPQSIREELCELLRLSYDEGWVSGTGGGICARCEDDVLFLAPSGVHKERIRPDDFFLVGVRDGQILHRPTDPSLKPSECGPIFREILSVRGAGSVMHSHALSAVLAADLMDPSGRLIIQGFEMLKGIRGCSNRDAHPVPVIDNTPEEPQLTAAATEVLRHPEFARTHCILVRDHGAYIWGTDLSETKRHAEVYHFLFEGVVARTKSGR